jgi:hypothetical protein
VTPEALSDPYVASYLSKGDDITVKIHIDSLISWYRTMSDWEMAIAIEVFQIAYVVITVIIISKERRARMMQEKS